MATTTTSTINLDQIPYDWTEQFCSDAFISGYRDGAQLSDLSPSIIGDPTPFAELYTALREETLTYYGVYRNAVKAAWIAGHNIGSKAKSK